MKYIAIAIAFVGFVGAMAWSDVTNRQEAGAVMRACIESGGKPDYTWSMRPLCEPKPR